MGPALPRAWLTYWPAHCKDAAMLWEDWCSATAPGLCPAWAAPVPWKPLPWGPWTCCHVATEPPCPAVPTVPTLTNKDTLTPEPPPGLFPPSSSSSWGRSRLRAPGGLGRAWVSPEGSWPGSPFLWIFPVLRDGTAVQASHKKVTQFKGISDSPGCGHILTPRYLPHHSTPWAYPGHLLAVPFL